MLGGVPVEEDSLAAQRAQVIQALAILCSSPDLDMHNRVVESVFAFGQTPYRPQKPTYRKLPVMLPRPHDHTKGTTFAMPLEADLVEHFVNPDEHPILPCRVLELLFVGRSGWEDVHSARDIPATLDEYFDELTADGFVGVQW
jgi:hypothetical protein